MFHLMNVNLLRSEIDFTSLILFAANAKINKRWNYILDENNTERSSL